MISAWFVQKSRIDAAARSLTALRSLISSDHSSRVSGVPGKSKLLDQPSSEKGEKQIHYEREWSYPSITSYEHIFSGQLRRFP